MITSTTPFVKSITASYEVAGRRKRLVGFVGELRDESSTVLHAQLYDTKPEAETALDALVDELLTDYAARGLVDTLPVGNEITGTCQCRSCIQPATHNVDGTLACCFHYSEELTGVLCGCTDDDYADAAWESDNGSYNGKVPSDFTQLDPPGDNPMGDSEGDPEPPDRPRALRLAQALANTIQAPACVVKQGDRYLIQDDDDLSVYCASVDPAAIVACFQPQPPRAVSLQSIAIESTMRRCHNCGANHRTWQCVEIGDRLFAPDATPWADVDLGRELCRMKWRDFRAFVALLLSVPPAHVLSYAASYQAFIKSYAPDSSLTINDVLRVWTKDMQRAQQAAA